MDMLKPARSDDKFPLVHCTSPSTLSVSVASKDERRTERTSGWDFWRRWKYELLSWCLIIGTFIAIIVTLGAYQNSPLPEWPLGFSLNTLLSIYGLLLKGPILYLAAEGLSQLKWSWLERTRPLHDLTIYDEASRGPWGAVKLVRSVHLRHVSALIGAFITIFALGLDPFTQAVVSYYSCSIAGEGLATISRMNALGTEENMPSILDSPKTSLQLLTSMFDSESIIAPYQCPGGNCTFMQPYHTLGICSECEDLTSSIKTECNNASYIEPSPEHPNCLHTLRGVFSASQKDTNLTVGFYGYTHRHKTGRASVYGNWTLLSSLLEAPRYGRQPDPGTLYTISMIAMTAKAQSMAFKCKLKACTRTYTSEVWNGMLVETLHSTSANWGQLIWDSMRSDPLDALGTRWQVRIDCLPPDVKARLISERLIVGDTEWEPWNWYYQLENPESSDPAIEYGVPHHCIYQYKIRLDLGGAMKSLNGSLKGFQDVQQHRHEGDPLTLSMTKYEWLNSTHDTVMGSDPTFANISAFAGDVHIGHDSHEPVILRTLYNEANLDLDQVSSAMYNYTTALTNIWRKNSTRPLQDDAERLASELYPNTSFADLRPAEGTAYQQTSCISVRWPWLAMPAGLILGSAVFLSMLMLESSTEPELWRSSQLALLWHGLEGPATEESSELESTKKMDKKAKEITVKLRRVGGSRKLMQTPQKGCK